MAGGAERRKGDPRTVDYRAFRSEGVSWKWLAGILVGVLILGAGSWAAYIQSQIGGFVVAMDSTKEKVGKQAVDQATTAEQVKAINQKVDDVKKDVQDIRSDIKLILQNQQQQQIQQQQKERR